MPKSSFPHIYIYPFTSYSFRKGNNPYLIRLISVLKKYFIVVNTGTRSGLFDIVLKLPKLNIIYFNWIEDLADKRFGRLQFYLLKLILFFSKRMDIKIIWFVHNNLSHSKENMSLKKKIVALMASNANYIIAHAEYKQSNINPSKFRMFPHPIDKVTFIPYQNHYDFDILIWGKVTPYKGVLEFLKYVAETEAMQSYKILIAGKFTSHEYYENAVQLKSPNVEIRNAIIPDTELEALYTASKFILYAYNSESVLSSGALCKSISYGKTVIGPHKGSFKELSDMGLIYTYNDFENLKLLLSKIELKETDPKWRERLQSYIAEHSWEAFGKFIADVIAEKQENIQRIAL